MRIEQSELILVSVRRFGIYLCRSLELQTEVLNCKPGKQGLFLISLMAEGSLILELTVNLALSSLTVSRPFMEVRKG